MAMSMSLDKAGSSEQRGRMLLRPAPRVEEATRVSRREELQPDIGIKSLQGLEIPSQLSDEVLRRDGVALVELNNTFAICLFITTILLYSIDLCQRQVSIYTNTSLIIMISSK